MTNGAASGPAGQLPERRRGQTVSVDLRGLALAAVLREGLNMAAAARRFGLGESTVRQWVKQFRKHRHVRPGKPGGSVARLERARERILRILAAQPDISMYGLRDALAAEGVTVDPATVQRFLKRHGLDRKSRLARRGRQGRGIGGQGRGGPGGSTAMSIT